MKRITKEFDCAMNSLHTLIDLTHEAIKQHRAAKGAAGLARLIEQQRHNLKLLLHKLEKARK